VIVANKFSEEAEGVALANDSIYGLAAAVFSSDAKQTKRVAHALNAGTVWINQYCVLHPGIPFGGFKQSGIGRELGSLGLEGYLQVSLRGNGGYAVDFPDQVSPREHRSEFVSPEARVM
jgi:aldehyde dehydrogenase (NAD+)